MSSDIPTGGIATPEAPAPSPPDKPQQAPQMEQAPMPAQAPQYPPYRYPYAPVPYYHPPAQRPPAPAGSHGVAWGVGSFIGVVLLGAALIALLAALIGGVVFWTAGQHEQTATSTQTFAVSGAPSLTISDAAGNISIRSRSASQVTVQVTKRAWGSSDAVAQRGLSHTVVDVRQSENTITVNAQFSTSNFDSGMIRRSVDLLLTVPAQTSADAQVGAGNIEARGITGAIRLDAGAGNVTADAVTFAGTSRLNTGAGNLDIRGSVASDATVDVHVGAGNATLSLPANTPAHLIASTGVGNLTITGWQIPVSHTGFTGNHASGDLGAQPTSVLTVQVGTGNLTLMSS
jgi:hypothetical protein